jgi:hypothetical protein
MCVAEGEATIVSVVPLTEAATEGFNFNSTDDAAMGVFSPITTTASETLATVQDVAAVPELGVAPTLAVHSKPGMKPVTVIVLPTYAKVGAIDATVMINNVAGNSTPVKVSRLGSVMIETVVAAARAVPAFLSPATVHVKEVPLEKD